VFFRRRKAIPTERITDVVLYQGPIMRQYFDIWSLHIQTAGTGSAIPEATLMGLVHPEEARDAILAAAGSGRDCQRNVQPDGEDPAG
jgi:membrane protein YdbS with pleckstrin-like domain